MSDKPPWWKLNRPTATPSMEQRRPKCRAYPTTGIYTGPTVDWCLAAQGEWCGPCQYRKE